MKTFEGSTVRHGTPSGWSKHQTLKQEPCDSCKAAKAKYDKNRRGKDDKVLMSRLRAKAQSLAEGELRRNHPLEYREAYNRHVKRLIEEQDDT